MRTIFKYNIERGGKIFLPEGAEVIHAGLQNREMHIWAIVDKDNQVVEREFAVRGTGWEVEPNLKHITTVFEGMFVWHVFEVLSC